MKPRAQVVVVDLEKVAFAINFEERHVVLVMGIVIRIEFVEFSNGKKHAGFPLLVEFRY